MKLRNRYFVGAAASILVVSSLVGTGFSFWYFGEGEGGNASKTQSLNVNVSSEMSYGYARTLISDEDNSVNPIVSSTIQFNAGLDPESDTSGIYSKGWMMAAYMMSNSDYEQLEDEGADIEFVFNVNLSGPISDYVEAATSMFVVNGSDMDKSYVTSNSGSAGIMFTHTLVDLTTTWDSNALLTSENNASHNTASTNEGLYYPDWTYNFQGKISSANSTDKFGELIKYKSGMKPDTDEEWSDFEVAAEDSDSSLSITFTALFRYV